MTKITIDTSFTDDNKRFPLYCIYPNQCQPQRAFVYLNVETGEVWTDTESFGGGTLSAYFDGTAIRWAVKPYIHNDVLLGLLNDNVDMFQTIVDDYAADYEYEYCDEGEQLGDGIEGGLLDLDEFILDELAHFKTLDDLVSMILEADGCAGFWFERELTVADVKDAVCALVDDGLLGSDDMKPTLYKDVAGLIA